MNLFKGLLFLQGQSTQPEFIDDEPHYGAATAAREFGKDLGNHAASERWFGHRHGAEDDFAMDGAASIGGCG